MTQEITWLDESYKLEGYSDYNHGLLRVVKGSYEGLYYGLMDLEKNLVIPAIYQQISFVASDENLFMVMDSNRNWDIVNRENKSLIHKGHFALPPVCVPTEGRIPVTSQEEPNKKYGFLDFKGNLVIPLIYDGVTAFSQGYAVVKKEGKYGYIDVNGNPLTPCIYNACSEFTYNIGVVKQGAYYGAINLDGDIILEIKYKSIHPYWENLMEVQAESTQEEPCLYGVFNGHGEQIAPFKYPWIVPHHNGGYVPVQLNDKMGLIDKYGKEVIPCEYEAMGLVDEAGFAQVSISKRKKALIHIEGKKITGYTNYLFGFKEGLCPVEKKRQWGFIDCEGNEVIEPQYKDATGFSQGLARVMNDKGKCGYINPHNEPVIPLIYHWITTFDGKGYACVRVGTAPLFIGDEKPKEGLIAKNGELLMPIIYDEVICTGKDHMVLVKEGKRWGFTHIKENLK